jgi:DNA-binding response OmpR family regulator
MRILAVDDEPLANMLVQVTLSKQGYEVETAENAYEAMQLIKKREPDLLLLDVAMPYMDGFEFSKMLRAKGYNMPIIFMTAQDRIEAKLQAFKAGGDDYICKPYNHEELIARVQAVLRGVKNRAGGAQSMRVGCFELFPSDLKVAVADRGAIILTRTEMRVLRTLMDNSGQVVKRDQLLAEVWNDDERNSNIVEVYIRRLRLKVEMGVGKPRHIVCVRGIGYKFFGK